MSSFSNVWILYNQAKEFSTTPAEIMGLEKGFAAYCLNRAVHYVGSTLEAELNAVKEDKSAKAKQTLIMHRWMRTTEKVAFRDPVNAKRE